MPLCVPLCVRARICVCVHLLFLEALAGSTCGETLQGPTSCIWSVVLKLPIQSSLDTTNPIPICALSAFCSLQNCSLDQEAPVSTTFGRHVSNQLKFIYLESWRWELSIGAYIYVYIYIHISSDRTALWVRSDGIGGGGGGRGGPELFGPPLQCLDSEVFFGYPNPKWLLCFR